MPASVASGSLASQLPHHIADDASHLVGVDLLARRAAADRLVHIAFGGQQALQLAAQLLERLLLDIRLRLAALAGVDPAQLQRGAESLGELRVQDHRVEQCQQAILQVARLVQLP